MDAAPPSDENDSARTRMGSLMHEIRNVDREKKLKSAWLKATVERFAKFEKKVGALIVFMCLHAPTPITGKLRAWTYATGKRSFEESLVWISALIQKTRASGPQSVSMAFNDDVNEFMGCLDPELAHVIEDLATELAKGDDDVSAIESELAELFVKPMDVETRHAVDKLARTEFKQALMAVTAAWKAAELVLPEQQANSNGAEDVQQASME